jgi:hypothetical protein
MPPAYTVRWADNSVLWCSDWSQVHTIPGAWQVRGTWHAPRQETIPGRKPRVPRRNDRPVNLQQYISQQIDWYWNRPQ